MNAAIETQPAYKILKLSSPEFADGDIISLRYTASGKNISPAFKIEGLTEDCKSMVMTFADNNSLQKLRVHWLVWNLPIVQYLKEDAMMGVYGKNDFGTNCFIGPIVTQWAHRYTFHVYGLDILLDIPSSSNSNALLDAMTGHIIAKGRMDILFKK